MKVYNKNNPQTVGERLKLLLFQNGKKEKDISELCHVTLGYVDGWLNDRRDIPSSHIVTLCKTFNVDCNWLLTGTVSKNMTVAADLGLNDASVSFLKKVNSADGLIDNGLTDGYADDEITTVTSMGDLLDGGIGIEALYPHEIKSIVNTLLSTTTGGTLLALLYKYVHIDFNSGLATVPDDSFHDVTGVCDEIIFSSDEGTKTSLPVSLMRYAVSQGIISVLDDLRENAKGE